MFTQIQTIKQNFRCTSADFNFNENLNYLAAIENEYVKIYNISDINEFNSKEGVNTKNFIKSSDTLVLSDMAGVISSYNMENNSEISKIEPGALKSWKFAISPNSNLLATGCTKFFLYDIDSGMKIYEVDNDNKYIYSMAYLNESLIALGNTNGSINLFNTDTKKKTLSLKGKN